MDDKFKELLRIAFYAGNECHKYCWSINEQFSDWYEVNESKLKNLGEGEAGTGYALLGEVFALLNMMTEDGVDYFISAIELDLNHDGDEIEIKIKSLKDKIGKYLA